MKERPSPPAAVKKPAVLVAHGDERIDPWYWLREKSDPAVLAHLAAENDYTAAVMAGTEDLREFLYAEMVARVQETDMSVPVRKGQWWYYHRTRAGAQYPVHCRQPDQAGRPGGDHVEQIMLDENAEAAGGEFFDLGAFDVSPDGQFLAYSTDRTGDEVFTLRVRDLGTGADLPGEIENTYYGTAWSRDGSTLFYVRPDGAHRPYQVWRHRIGSESLADELVFTEGDERFFAGVRNSKTDDLVVIATHSSLTSEIRLLSSDDPWGEFAVVVPRREGVEYHVSHHRSARDGDRLFMWTNEDAPNFRLLVAPIPLGDAERWDAPRRENGLSAVERWDEVVPHRPDVKLDHVEVFADALALSERAEALSRIRLLDLATGDERVVDQEEDVYAAWVGANPEFDSHVLRYSYTSLVTPSTVYDLDLRTHERTLLKRAPVLGGYDSTRYRTERRWATAPDGARVPISLVYRRDRAAGPGPLVLYGYGAYEASREPTFSSFRLSLLDRGVAFAIAHVRGGGEMGRAWYEQGKFFAKTTTFTDFIACAQSLVDDGVTSPDQLVIRGGSAGGLLIGAALNLRPDLFAAAVAEVPFVDVLTTMLDPSLPLTVHEYEEWGDPNDPAVYSYLASYSPYDNVRAVAYPYLLVTAGLNDPRVSYWEPAKWVQRLRERGTGDHPILLRTQLGAGHMGPSGRYDAWRDEAFVYAFILWALHRDAGHRDPGLDVHSAAGDPVVPPA
jgi:oligopeptidase B